MSFHDAWIHERVDGREPFATRFRLQHGATKNDLVGAMSRALDLRAGHWSSQKLVVRLYEHMADWADRGGSVDKTKAEQLAKSALLSVHDDEFEELADDFGWKGVPVLGRGYDPDEDEWYDDEVDRSETLDAAARRLAGRITNFQRNLSAPPRRRRRQPRRKSA